MQEINQKFSVPFQYKTLFTENMFDVENNCLKTVLEQQSHNHSKKILCVFDKEMSLHHPGLFNRICKYAEYHNNLFEPVRSPIIIPGGETAKNDRTYVDKILQAIDDGGIDRHSYVMVIGGGAVIDTAGYAAAIAHRGIRTIRIPTTVLAQNDASLGVKNGVNAFGKKNFLGTFVPPFAVINDSSFLKTLDQRDWISGISEAIKVALLKDSSFFDFISTHAGDLQNRVMPAMKRLIYRCAELHLEHIATSGDPFEMGSSRPLDFGHWSAHKLEQLTNFELKHGEAVAIGIALDVVYSNLQGLIDDESCSQILNVIENCGFKLFVPELKSKLDQPNNTDSLIHGLTEFREHLGGQLTIMLLEGIGKGIEVHEVDFDVYREAIDKLAVFESANNELLNAT
ncbi:MAG: 3-dehydroquinate synthase [Balneolaceae bacterium]|nr:3-dehydroquinate synthase [Balneolaceae bacterium]